MDDALSAKANFWSRIGASLVDGVILFVAYIVVIGVAVASGSDVAAVIAVIFYLVAGVFYAPVLMARSGACNGQTWGRQAVGVRVVPISGAPINFGAAFLREFVGKTLFYTFSIYICLIVDLVMGFATDNGQTLHDKVASTVVLNAGASPALAPAVASLSPSAGYPPPPGAAGTPAPPYGSQPPPPQNPPSLQK